MAFAIDRDGLALLYDCEAQRLLRFFVRRTYDPQLAMDLISETFARAYERRTRFSGSTREEASAWLWQRGDALRRGHAERRALRRFGIRVPTLSVDEHSEVERHADLRDLKEVVSAALETLAPQQREALRLRIVLDLDYATVAQRLGISQPAARARVSRGLRALSAALDVSEGAT